MHRDQAEELRAGAGAPRGPRPLTVLLVDHDPADAATVRALIEAAEVPIDLHRCATVAEALPRLAEADCVLLDLDLPDTPGLAALARLQGAQADPAIVVLTDARDAGDGIDAVSAGAQDYLATDSLDAAGLVRAVTYAVERKSAQRAAAALQAGRLQERENRRLMRGLLPAPLLGADDRVRVEARYRPRAVRSPLGGDFYDVVEDDRGRVQVLIGDVSGHGPAAAALGVALRIAWRTLVLAGVPAGGRLRRLDRLLRAERHAPHVFATATCLSIDPDSREVLAHRAGHPGLLEVGPERVRWIEPAGGPALGAVGDRTDRPAETITVAEGAWLLLLTDGLFEGRVDAAGTRLGEHGLRALVADVCAAAGPGEEPLDAVLAAVQARSAPFGGLDDDVAVLRIHW